MRKFLSLLVVLAVVGFPVVWFVTRADPLPDDALAGLTPDPSRGEQVFWAAGCASCHMAEKAEGDAQLELVGGQKFPSDFGTFVAPNISPDPQFGIGGWTALDLANAMTRGVSPEGRHYYPVFPYASYIRMELQDVVDLKSYLDTLPPVATPSQPHDVGFPFNIRRTLGGWKFLYLDPDWVLEGDLTPEIARGRYLVEAMAHCGECHTPRGSLGGLERDRWLAGAPNPAGRGSFPNLTPAKLDWSESDIAEYLTSGFTPEFDTAGGHMALVVRNMARLPDSDRAAIASYLKALPPAE